MTTVRSKFAGRRPTIYLVVGIVLACALVYAATMAIIEWQRRNDLHNVLSVRNQVAQVAADEAAALSTYDYRDPTAAKTRILEFATGAFAQQEESEYTGVASSIAQLKATGTATVEESLASNADHGQADAFVVVVASTKSTSGTAYVTQYLRMNLVLSGGKWKVDEIEPLDAPST